MTARVIEPMSQSATYYARLSAQNKTNLRLKQPALTSAEAVTSLWICCHHGHDLDQSGRSIYLLQREEQDESIAL